MTATRTCSKCEQVLPETEFHADNRSGWSRACKTCRQRRQWRVEKRRQRKKLDMMAKAEVEISTIKSKNLNDKLKQLISEFKKFTLPNRNRLRELEKRASKHIAPNAKTKNAIANRRLNQQRAEEILQYQISIVSVGLKTIHISDLWRAQYGTDARSESQSENQEDIG